MRELPLTQGKVALVDDDDYERVAQYKWHAYQARHGRWYAKRHTSRTTGRHTLYLHRFILNVVSHIDHKNHDGLDNRRCNLRPATRNQNNRNRGMSCRNRIGYKGVRRARNNQRWGALITVNNKQIWLGMFNSQIDAARAYDAKARELHGEFAGLNFPDGGVA